MFVAVVQDEFIFGNFVTHLLYVYHAAWQSSNIDYLINDDNYFKNVELSQ